MRKLLVLIVIVAAVYFAYQKFVVGESSEELKQVQALADDFSAIKQQMTQAERAAGVSGMDMTSEANNAMAAAEALHNKLQELMGGLTEEKALAKAEELEAEIKAFRGRE